MKAFLGGLATFVVAVLLTSAAFLAVLLGYSLVVCPDSGPVGWALLDFIGIFIVAPGLLSIYVIAVIGAVATLRPMRRRFGVARMMLATVAVLAGLVAISSAGSALLGLTARCSFGF